MSVAEKSMSAQSSLTGDTSSDANTTSSSGSPSNGQAGVGGGPTGQSRSAEFKKLRHLFESTGSVEVEEMMKAKRLRDLVSSQRSALVEPGLDFSRRSRSDNSEGDGGSSLKRTSMPHPPDEPVQRQRVNAATQRDSMSGQRFIDEDDDGLGPPGTFPVRCSSNSQQVVALNEENGQKERVLLYSEMSSPLTSQSDDSEREDPGLSQQIEILTTKNHQLQKQLEEREQERNRLRDQLEMHRIDKNYRSIYSPPGLPSRVLDGRKVLRDSVPLVTSPGIPSYSSSIGGVNSSRSPLPRSSVSSPLSVPPIQSPQPLSAPPSFSHSPRSRLPVQSMDYDNPLSKRRNVNPEEFILPRTDVSVSSDCYLQQQVEGLKRDNVELERRLHELSDEKRRTELELKFQKEAFYKMQAREQDLSKDIEILRDENFHHTSAIKRLHGEREELKAENESLQDELANINNKLNKTEKCYKEVEHENLSLEAEIEQLVCDKKRLFEEKQELQIAVEDTLKTKENYRSTIKRLREQNQSLESSMSQPGVRTAKPEKKKVVVPATKEQKTLSEVMNLREDNLELQGRLLSAQQEIDSLEAHLKVQDTKEEPSEELSKEIANRLSQFQAQIEMVGSDLKSAQTSISFFSSQQQALVRESFLILVGKCRGLLQKAEKDKTKLSEAMLLTESSLVKIMEECEVLKGMNSKLQIQRDTILNEVSVLKDEVANLQDQKRLQSIKLAQNESITQQKDEKIGELELTQKQLQERYSKSESNWKKEHKKLEIEWEGKVAEALQNCEFFSEEKENLIAEKAILESRLAEVLLDNKNLMLAKEDLEMQIKEYENRIVNITQKLDENGCTICSAQESIANLLVQKSCLRAQLRITQQDFAEKLDRMAGENAEKLAESLTECDDLQQAVESLKFENSLLVRKSLEEISNKEQLINMFESKISVLTSTQANLRSEMASMTEKHSSVVQEFQLLEEAEHSRRLDNEKIKMTLTTEIKLLKSKLSSVEEEKSKLEKQLFEMESETKPSAFHTVPSSWQVEHLKKQIMSHQGESRQQRKINLETAGNRSSQFAELQNRFSLLETENKQLKESAMKNPTSPHSGLDEETVTNLRKKVTEMLRKTFFLESDKQHLTDKLKSLTASLKSARETKDHITSEHIKKIQEDNRKLREKVHNLEGNLTKKLMAADSKIVKTVEENDRLKQKLSKIQTTLNSQNSDTESLLSSLKNESEVLQELSKSLSVSNKELEKLESFHQTIESLQQEIQLTYPVKETESPMSPPQRNVPAVFKSLPAGYISNLQGHRGSMKLESRSASFSGINPDLQKKLSEMSSATAIFGEGFRQHKISMRQKDEEMRSFHERLVTLEGKFRSESERSRSLQNVLTGKQGLDLSGEQLQSIMQKQIEKLQDQVLDRDSALSDIETQMKSDFEMHHKKFAQMKSQVIELREQLSSMTDVLRSKDQYIQKTEDRSLGLENELFKVRKELERVLHEQNELVRQGLLENIQLQGVNSVSDVIRIQGEELNQLQNVLREFTCELSQVQSQLESVQREKSVLQSKAIEMERMHVQMKDHMGTDINYLRQLNLQLVEQQMKAERATEILKEVKEAQNAFKKQRDMIKMESEFDASRIKLMEQSHKITELECQLASQALSIKILHAEKEHSIMLSHHTPELANQITSIHMRPRSAESARKPKYKISDFKPRIGTSGRNINSEFSIVLPSQNSSHGNSREMDILNLEEEQPDTENAQRILSLGPMVVTDDEYTVSLHKVEKLSGKHQRFQRVKRGHRRTASTGSNVIPVLKEKELIGPKISNPISGASQVTGKQTHPLQNLTGSGGSLGGQKSLLKNPRPSSARSTRQDVHIRQESKIRPTEQITKTAHSLTEYINSLIGVHSLEQLDKVVGKDGKDIVNSSLDKKEPKSAGGRSGTLGNASSTSGKITGKGQSRFDTSRNKFVSKSSDSNETTSSDGNGFSSKGSSQSDSSGGHRSEIKPCIELTGRVNDRGLPLFNPKGNMMTDLSRTESMSSTCSTLSIYGNSTLPSRNHSFTYDGGESSTYSHESLEIGNSEENLQALGKLGYSPYINPIMPENYTTSSSDDENYQKNRRKKSSTTGDNTPRHKDVSSYHSSSSCDSDTLQQESYHGNANTTKHVDIPVHVNESISISDMDRDTTDIEMEQKAADLQQCFGRVRYSSTGSVKICYSVSSNTSMEDISKRNFE